MHLQENFALRKIARLEITAEILHNAFYNQDSQKYDFLKKYLSMLSDFPLFFPLRLLAKSAAGRSFH